MLDDSAAINRRLLPLDRVGNTLHLAAVARGGDAGNSKPQTIELAGNDLKPYAPVHLTASGSFGADMMLSWVRRTRIGGDLKDGFGTVLLAEDTEEYELEILGPDDDVRRAVPGLTSSTFTYTVAMQAEDFPEGYPVSAFVVYQTSAQVGRGFSARFDFPDAPQLTTVATINDVGDVAITAAASGQMLRFNGASWVNEDSPYDLGMFIPGTHGNGALLAQVVLTRAVSCADDFAGARAYAGVSATAATVLDVHRNGSPIGTITFGIGASAGTFATAGGGAETFAAGDRLAIINENPADATLADLSITFLGKRT
jgi:hypothetical protein